MKRELSPELELLITLKERKRYGVVWDPASSHTFSRLRLNREQWIFILRELARRGLAKRRVKPCQRLASPSQKTLTYYVITPQGLDYLKGLGL